MNINQFLGWGRHTPTPPKYSPHPFPSCNYCHSSSQSQLDRWWSTTCVCLGGKYKVSDCVHSTLHVPSPIPFILYPLSPSLNHQSPIPLSQSLYPPSPYTPFPHPLIPHPLIATPLFPILLSPVLTWDARQETRDERFVSGEERQETRDEWQKKGGET